MCARGGTPFSDFVILLVHIGLLLGRGEEEEEELYWMAFLFRYLSTKERRRRKKTKIKILHYTAPLVLPHMTMEQTFALIFTALWKKKSVGNRIQWKSCHQWDIYFIVISSFSSPQIFKCSECYRYNMAFLPENIKNFFSPLFFINWEMLPIQCSHHLYYVTKCG